MPKVVGVKFKTSNKSYYFDPLDIHFVEGDVVIVETARGIEYGTVSASNMVVPDDKIVPPLRPIVRKATEEDKQNAKKLDELSKDTMKKALPKVAEFNPNMKLVDTEYTFDQSKIIFYFTANGREDFRELVRCLAGMFRRRIEMRQIDEREDIKMRGGFGICGRECCCTCFSGSRKASIKMAKNQNLSLNPTKISGLCGKLMCCLKYENDYYAEACKKVPKIGSTVKSPEGEGVVVSNDMLKMITKLKISKGDGSEIYKDFPVDRLEFKRKTDNSSKNDDDEEIITDDMKKILD